MISSAIWISSNEARAFRLTPDKVEHHHFKKHGPQHHAVQHGRHHTESQDDEKFFGEVGEALMKNTKDRFLIVGPGPAKLHFKTYLNRHFPLAAAAIVGVEPMDHATDGEILDFAHHFFRKIDTFE